MNIVGEGLPVKIGNQIRKRQEIYGSLNRTTEELLYLNSRTSFVKAISSVDIENYDTNSIINTRPELASVVSNYGGSELARNFILFNGTSKEGGILRAGIPQELLTGANKYINDFAYGFGGLEYGIRPMPGIISMQTTSQGSYGSVESTTLNIKAWNRVQFEIIDLLYLRLGYSVLVEWGNTSYFDNSGVYIPNNPYTLEAEFLNGILTPDTIYSKIQQYKLDSNGNYDAIYGVVTNFNWTFDRNGGYDITVKLISKGDIIEGIKTAVLVSEKNDTSTFEIPEAKFQDLQKIATTQLAEANPQDTTRVAGVTTTEQNAILADLATQNSSTPSTPATVNQKEAIYSLKDSHTLARLYYNVQQLFSNKDPNVIDEPLYYSQVYFQPGQSDTKPYFTQKYQGPDPKDDKSTNGVPLPKKYYIRLGSLLAFIQSNIIPKEKKGNALYSSLKIDYSTTTNLAYTNEFQVSIDPNICLISTELTQNQTVAPPASPLTYTFAKGASKYKKTLSGIQVGQIMNIYVNFDYIISIINSNGDPKNQTSLYTFLETLCNGLSISLGGINTFRPFVDTTTNTLKIIDETALPNRNTILKEVGGRSTIDDPVLQIYGYNYERNPITNDITQGYAGFVRDFRFTSKLDPKFAQIISIGATSQGGIVGEDATAFTSLNRGLTDRIKPEIFASTGYTTDSTINIGDTSLENQFKESLVNLEKYLGSIGCDKDNPTKPFLNEIETSSYTNLLATVMQYTETKTAVTQKKSSGTMGFIPVSVGLTLDGISGLKLLNGIKIDTSYLPSNYPETMLFVISKLSHKIENNVWTTDLETIMTPDNTIQSDGKINVKNRKGSGSSKITGREVVSTAEQNRRGVQIIQFFVNKGLTQEQAAGIAGNFFAESGLQPNIVNQIGAYGLGQWLGQRRANLFTLASSRGESEGNISIETQLEFTWNELQSYEANAYRSLIAQTTTEDAATSFVNKFERPSEAEKAQSLDKRIAYARKFLTEYLA